MNQTKYALMIVAGFFLSACGASNDLSSSSNVSTTTEESTVVDDSAQAGLEGHLWLVTAMPKGFDTQTNVDKATVTFTPADQTISTPRISIDSVCHAPGRGTLIEFSGGSFMPVPWPAEADEEIIGLGDACDFDDDLHSFLEVEDKIEVTIEGDIATLSHSTFELELTRSDLTVSNPEPVDLTVPTTTQPPSN